MNPIINGSVDLKRANLHLEVKPGKEMKRIVKTSSKLHFEIWQLVSINESWHFKAKQMQGLQSYYLHLIMRRSHDQGEVEINYCHFVKSTIIPGYLMC